MKQTRPQHGNPDRFLYAHARSPDWERSAEQCLQQLGYVAPETSLGFLYVSDHHADMLDTIVAHFRHETGVRDWVGTVGIGLCATGTEYFETAAMSTLLCTLPEDSYRILPPVREPGFGGLPVDDWLNRHPTHLGIVHGDPRNGDTAAIIERLAAHVPGGFLVGGLSSSRGREPQIAGQVVEGGVSGVILSDAVPVISGLSQGCSPVAGQHRITACERNIIAEIDGRPALDVFFEDIGEILARDLNRIAGYIFAGLPQAGSDTGDYLVRSLVGVDSENRLLAIGDLVETGQPILFCRRDAQSAWQDLQRMLDRLAARLEAPPRGGLYFSCLGRGRNLFGEDSAELRAIRHRLGDFPLVGFFANGEIARDRLYGYTGVLTLFL